MKIGKSGGELEKLEMNMTPMIDVCFQLIIFFMLSLRLFSPEGDFSIKMPLAAPQRGAARRDADAAGQDPPPRRPQRQSGRHPDGAADARPRSRSCTTRFARSSSLDRGPAATPGSAEVELDCDYNLKFEYVVDALDGRLRLRGRRQADDRPHDREDPVRPAAEAGVE